MCFYFPIENVQSYTYSLLVLYMKYFMRDIARPFLFQLEIPPL